MLAFNLEISIRNVYHSAPFIYDSTSSPAEFDGKNHVVHFTVAVSTDSFRSQTIGTTTGNCHTFVIVHLTKQSECCFLRASANNGKKNCLAWLRRIMATHEFVQIEVAHTSHPIPLIPSLTPRCEFKQNIIICLSAHVTLNWFSSMESNELRANDATAKRFFARALIQYWS